MFSPVCFSYLSYGSWSANVAVIVPVCASIVSLMSLNVIAPTNVSVIRSDGHSKSKSSIDIGSVVTSNSPLPCLVGVNGAVAVTVVSTSSRPLGSFDPLGVIQPTVAETSASSVAVPAPVPAPATSPVAVNVAPSVLSTVSVGSPTKCSPPLRVVVSGAIANAPVINVVDVIAISIAIIAGAITLFILLSGILGRKLNDILVIMGYDEII